MRILYLCGDQGIPAFGRKGASTHLREMIAAFRHLGHEVCLAAADLSGDRRPEENFRAEKLPQPLSRKLGIDGRYLLANFLARKPLLELARDFKPDAIYERSSLYFGSGEWLATKLGIPRVLEVNALLSEEQQTRLHFPGFAHQREARLIRRAAGVAAISNYMVKRLVALGRPASQTRPFPMAVDPARFHPVEDPQERRRALGWAPDDIVLGYVGSMNHYHRPIWFMDLAEKLLRKGAPVRFLVVGGSASKIERFRGRLLRWVNEGRVHFEGSVPQEQLSSWLAAMDAILVPGAAPQSTPTKIFEAAAVGCPLLLPATEPIAELCGPNANYLFRPEDFNSFEDKVKAFLGDPSPFRTDAKALQEKVLAHHTWEQHARELADWFSELGNARENRLT